MSEKQSEYKLIDGFNEYRVGDDGSVWSHRSGEWVRLSPRKQRGYMAVILYQRGKKQSFTVHRLVLEAFIGKRPLGCEHCCHANGIKHDNSLSNLRWGTAKSNYEDARKHGTATRGERMNTARLKSAEVMAILNNLKQGNSRRLLAKQYGVAKTTIRNIADGRSWSWLTGIKRAEG